MTKLLAALVLAMIAGCATTPESKPISLSNPSLLSFYTLNEGQKIENKMPLPDMTKILVNWTYSDGGQKAQEGFKGWDFDHDGRFEMLEVLDSTGKPYMWAYDFDADGVVDAVEKQQQSQFEDLNESTVEK